MLATPLNVGGRPGMRERLCGNVSGLGGSIDDHDGGTEHARSLLPGRADAVVFPVDCVGHWAMKQVRRLCVAQDRPFYALRSARITAFLGALPQIRAALTG